MSTRREFITLVGGAAAWPMVARAQQPAMPVVGFLHHASPPNQIVVDGLRDGLGQAGYVEGRNVELEFRWAEDNVSRLPELAADLVRRHVAVITTPGSTPAALAAKASTRAIPIVFYVGTDPVQIGLVASCNRPGGNATGISSLSTELGGKRLDLLRELLPQATRFGLLINPANRASESVTADVRAATARRGWHIEV